MLYEYEYIPLIAGLLNADGGLCDDDEMVVSSSKVNLARVGERRPAGQLVNLQSCILKIESSGVNFNNDLVRMRLPIASCSQ